MKCSHGSGCELPWSVHDWSYEAAFSADPTVADEPLFEDEKTYKVVRFHFDENHPEHRMIVKTGLTLDEAQDHCNDEDTHGDGWFDGYTEE